MSMWLSLFPVILPTRYFLWIAALLFFICPIYPQKWELFSSLEGLYITHLFSPHNHPPSWMKGLSLVIIWKTMFFPIRGKLGYLSMTNLDSILKNKDITLLTKARLVKTMVFPVVRYRYENWTIKKAESQRIDALELRCWRRLLRALELQEDQTSQF